MKEQEILSAIEQLSRSQGLYGRILQTLKSMKEDSPAQYETFMGQLERQNFKDTVDLVMYFET